MSELAIIAAYDWVINFLAKTAKYKTLSASPLGIPLEFSANLYGKVKESQKGLQRKSIKTVIRQSR